MPQEIDELTLTAYALGELDGPEQAVERAQLETCLASDEVVRRQVEEIRATAQQVRVELAVEITPGLTELQHAAIERRLEQSGALDAEPLPLRPIRRNWAFWGSLAASIVIVCTVMASVLPKLYHLGSAGHADGGGGLATPATGAAPFIVENPEPSSVASPDLSKPLVRDEPFVPVGAGGFVEAAPPVERGENAFVRVADAPLCGIPMTCSYPEAAGQLVSIARFLDNHKLPPAETLRTDEIINSLPYHYAAPTTDEGISANVEIAGCPWNPAHKLLRIGLRSADATPTTKPSTSPSLSAGGIAGFKAQVEFNPLAAGAYRLIGYETGPSAGNFSDGSAEVRNASFLVAGRSITVLYEVVPAGMGGPSAPLPLPPLKYQKLTPVAETSRELATVSIRWRGPASPRAAQLREIPVTDDGRSFAGASEDFRSAAAAAAFGLALRNSAWKGSATYQLVIDTLGSVSASDAAVERANLLEMAKMAKAIVGGE